MPAVWPTGSPTLSPTLCQRLAHAEHGSVTAEFATVMPAVIMVLACCLSAGQLAAGQMRLQDAASGAARSLARGEAAELVNQRVEQLAPRASVRQSVRGEVLCVTVTQPGALGVGLAATITLEASGCALRAGA